MQDCNPVAALGPCKFVSAAPPRLTKPCYRHDFTTPAARADTTAYALGLAREHAMLAQPVLSGGGGVLGHAVVAPKAGFLEKVGGLRHNWLPRWCAIEGTLLAYYERSTTSSGSKDTRKGEITLSGALGIGASTAADASPTELQIVTNERTYRLRAETVAERDDWLAVLSATSIAHGGLRGTADDLARGRFCTISCRGADKLLVTHCLPEVAAALQAVIEGGTLWNKGLQKAERKGEEQIFKLKGNPWWASGEDTVQSRRLMCGILETMFALNWELVVTSDLSRVGSDCDTFIFKARTTSAPAQTVIGVSTHETDKIRLVNAPPEETEQLTDVIRQAVARAWPQGVQREQVYGGSQELKLKGRPFWADGADTIHVRQLMMQV